jgi:HSP20 family protein
MNSIKKDEELTVPNWSDFFSEHGISTRWPFHKMDLFPAVNIKESDEAFHTEMAVPGFSKKDFKIDIEGSYLTISAEKIKESNKSNERYTKKEFESKSFSRTFNLPENVDPDKIEATYQEGILQLIIPKKEKRKPTLKKKIKLS